jgi:hypothetical protein
MCLGYIGTVEQIFTHYATITPVTLFYGFLTIFLRTKTFTLYIYITQLLIFNGMLRIFLQF